MTIKPVTTSGWYEQADGTVAYFFWQDGQVVRGDVVASWADVRPPTSPWDEVSP